MFQNLIQNNTKLNNTFLHLVLVLWVAWIYLKIKYFSSQICIIPNWVENKGYVNKTANQFWFFKLIQSAWVNIKIKIKTYQKPPSSSTGEFNIKNYPTFMSPISKTFPIFYCTHHNRNRSHSPSQLPTASNACLADRARWTRRCPGFERTQREKAWRWRKLIDPNNDLVNL